MLLVSTSSETEENQAEPHNTVPTGSLAEYDPSTLKRWSVSPLQTSAPTLLIACADNSVSLIPQIITKHLNHGPLGRWYNSDVSGSDDHKTN